MTSILWHSNAPWAPTGYGQQTAEFVPRFKALGHDIAISANWGLGGQVMDWEGIRVYPADDTFGDRTLRHVAARHSGPDVETLTIMLQDVWVNKNHDQFKKMNVAAWVPIDHEPVPPGVAQFFRATGATPVAMSRFGDRMLREAGLAPYYVPHGIDTTVFRPKPDEALEFREAMELPADAFVVGMNAANKGNMPPRKAFAETINAFAEFARRHDDVFLYLHTDILGFYGGVNLPMLVAAARVPEGRVKHVPPMVYESNLDRELVATMYSGFDVLANPSYGEGFGIPIVEAQACGTPVIVTDCSAMTELCGAGWLVDGYPFWNQSQGSYFKAPVIADILDAMEDAYARRGDQDLSDRARAFALEYDAARVMDTYWVPVLEKLLVPKPKVLEPIEQVA